MTRVLVVDDHQLLRQALRRSIEESGMFVVSEAADGEEAVRLAAQLDPDVVVMDVTMPVLDGIEATRRIHGHDPQTRVVILTMHDEEALRVEAIRAGAVGFLNKDCAMHEVVETVRSVADGDVVLSSEIASAMVEALDALDAAHANGSDLDGVATNGSDPSPLTRREREILQAVADGQSTADIARTLFISVKTVKNHLASIYAKLEARDRTQAVLSGVRLGIVQLT